jgi:hypothetical protein
MMERHKRRENLNKLFCKRKLSKENNNELIIRCPSALASSRYLEPCTAVAARLVLII